MGAGLRLQVSSSCRFNDLNLTIVADTSFASLPHLLWPSDIDHLQDVNVRLQLKHDANGAAPFSGARHSRPSSCDPSTQAITSQGPDLGRAMAV